LVFGKKKTREEKQAEKKRKKRIKKFKGLVKHIRSELKKYNHLKSTIPARPRDVSHCVVMAMGLLSDNGFEPSLQMLPESGIISVIGFKKRGPSKIQMVYRMFTNDFLVRAGYGKSEMPSREEKFPYTQMWQAIQTLVADMRFLQSDPGKINHPSYLDR